MTITKLPDAVFARRLSVLRKNIGARGLDAAVLTNINTHAYFADMWAISPARTAYMIVPSDGREVTLLVGAVDAEFAQRRGRNLKVVEYRDWLEEGPAAELLKLLAYVFKNYGIKRAGFELDHLSASTVAAIRDVVPDLAITDIARDLKWQRSVKDDSEIAIFRALGQMAVVEFDALLDAVAPGVPEYELTLAATNAGTRFAANYIDDELMYPIIGGLQVLTSGPNMSMPHKRSSSRRLEKGDLIQPCFCNITNFAGYGGSFGRVIAVGEASADDHKLQGHLLEAREAALETIKPGNRARDVYAVISEKLPLGNEYRILHRHGRGLGHGVTFPELAAYDETELAPGMIMSLEPAVYAPGRDGQRIEDIVLVTEAGAEVLTPYRAEIIEKAVT